MVLLQARSLWLKGKSMIYSIEYEVSFCVTSAYAFTVSKPSTSFKYVGDTKPLGYFDPLLLTQNTNEETVKYLREAELQHGRTAMVASVIFPTIELTTHVPAINVLSEKVGMLNLHGLHFSESMNWRV